MGSLLLALGLATPMYLTVRHFLIQYRPVVKRWIYENGWHEWLGLSESALERVA
jgi:hypothetical protein